MSPPPPTTAQGPKGPMGDLTGEEIVISGISGIFPSSNNTLEFMENLFNQVDMVTAENLNFDHPEAPKHLGKISGTRKFDAQFFRVAYNQAVSLEPMSRKLLEHAYTAMYDSGINPLAYKGRKVGVFVGSSYSDTANVSMYEVMKSNGSILSGSSKAMYANRISFWIDGRGPSYTLDCTCSSSMVCLEHAYSAIKSGQCDAALVGGCHLCIHPLLGFNLKRGGFVCLDGKTKCFDKNGDGYVRAEAVNVLFLQKAKEAKRIYMEVCHADVKYGLKPDADFLPLRKAKDITSFLYEFYSDANISPKEVGYIEAHGSAIAESDANELEAIGEVFGTNKNNPVYVGSVKSNMGNSEPASGVCALTKLCLSYHKGELPANLHYSEPIDNITCIKDGTVRVLEQNIPFDRGYTALNNFSYTGKNCHALLRGHFKKKDLTKYKSGIPRLIVVSGRQEDSVNKILDILSTEPLDPEVIGMLHNIYKIDTPGHTCRGYTIIDTKEKNETATLARGVEYYSGITKPLWLLYSGMGSQWAGMGAALMNIPTFAAAMEKCNKVLKPVGIDIIKIITENKSDMFENILHSFVGITAVQIGLTDILKEIGVNPDFIIGHSLGEMGCAYWDGSLTAEETILGSYCRGAVSSEIKFVPGTMAAVGLGYKDILPICPPEIDIACHNSSESTTLTGPTEIVKEFITTLTSRGVFAKEVQSSNIAFHSRYMRHAGPEFSRRMAEVIKEPRLRSSKWICTSIPQDRWDEPLAKYSSPEFYTNNLLSPVYFEEASSLIPKNAVVVEIAPHGLLQAILKRSHPECTHIPLTRRGHADPVTFMLEAIGKLYQQGFNIKCDSLYPKIDYPVSTSTSLLSHYVEWEHSEDWPIAVHSKMETVLTPAREVMISVQDDDYKFLSAHVRDGNNIFPEAAILFLVWETLAMYLGMDYQELSVVFSDIHFHSEIIIKPEESVNLSLMISKGNNNFEVSHNNMIVANGRVVQIMKPRFTVAELKTKTQGNHIVLSSETVYNLMNLRGYCYKDAFQSISSVIVKQNSAKIKWDGNWISFIDSLIQLNMFVRNHEGLSVPKIIKQLLINTKAHNEDKKLLDFDSLLEAKLSGPLEITRCAGVEIRDIYFEDKPIKEIIPDLNTSTFVPHFTAVEISLNHALCIIMQIISANITEKTLNIIELNDDSTKLISDLLRNGLKDNFPNVDFEIKTITTNNVVAFGKPHSTIMQGFLQNEKMLDNILDMINRDAFILSLDTSLCDDLKKKMCTVVAEMAVEGHKLFLLRKVDKAQEKDVHYILVDYDEKFSWIPTVENALKKFPRVVLVSEREPHCGLLGLVTMLRKRYKNKINLVVVDDYHASSFDLEKNIYKEQLSKNLVINIFKKGCWGGYYHLPCPNKNNVKHFHLTCSSPGDISSLAWVESIIPPKQDNLVEVCYAGPSVRDSQMAVGRFQNNDKLFGMDFSGVDGRGKKVMGMIAKGAIASTVQPDIDLIWPVPKHWSMEDAATVPLPYVHAYYCLIIKGNLSKRQSVFVNGGAGALGQAVISVALAQACTIYTTVSDMDKKRFLLNLFPELDENNIGYSGHENFNAMVISNSKNKRCDWVISSLSGDLRSAAMKCVGSSGIFQDVNPCDMENNQKLGMSFGEQEKSYQSVLLSNIFRPENWKEKKLIQLKIAEGISNGTVRPLSRVIYPSAMMSKAFRLLSQRKHRGRVLLQMKDSENSTNRLNATPRMSYSSDGTYIIKCDSTEFGIELADRIIRHGAKKVMLSVDSKSIMGHVHAKLPLWRERGASISIFRDKIKSEDHCVQLLKLGSEMGHIEGIFIIQECVSKQEERLKQDVFMNVFDNTASIVSMFDSLSRNYCPNLSQFVVISKSSFNYANAYAIAASEKICQVRAETGLPALVFQINSTEQNAKSENILKTPSLKSIFNSLEISMKQNHTVIHMSHGKKRHSNLGISEKLAQVLGVKDINKIDEKLTLNDFVNDEVTIEEIKAFLKKTYCVSYTTEALKGNSIESLRNLENMNAKHNTKSNSGFNAFYSYIDKDEYTATDFMIPMKSMLCKRIERDDQVNEDDTHLFLIPGFEGHHHIFVPVCQRLKIKAMTFQLGPDIRSNSIREIAFEIKKFMQNRFKMKSKFYLLGYSFGINVALELAYLLEKDGLTGVIYCLDSSPDAVRANLNAYMGKRTDSQLQIMLIEHIFSIMTGQDKIKINVNLEEMTWTEKVDVCVSKLKEHATYTSQYTRDVLEAAYRRIKLAKTYEPNFKLGSELVLMRGVPHQNAEKLPGDYNLSKYTTKPVKIFDLTTNHPSTPYDSRVSNIINKTLDEDILVKYKNTNLCEVYTTDAFVFE